MKAGAAHTPAGLAAQGELATGDRAIVPADQSHSLVEGARAGSFRLLRYFSIASLVAIVLAVAGLGFFFREPP